MRTELVEAEGWKIEVRGRTRRTSALESEYLLTLQQAHPDMRMLPAASSDSTESKVSANPHGWSLAGIAAPFRLLAARICLAIPPDAEPLEEPFNAEALIVLFDHYLDAEQLPDRSDLWSVVEATIRRMDAPQKSADPLASGSAPSK